MIVDPLRAIGARPAQQVNPTFRMRLHLLLLITLLLFAVAPLSAQLTWSYAGGPDVGQTLRLAYDNQDDVFLGSDMGALYRLNHGETRWTRLFDDLPLARGLSVLHAAPDGTIYAVNMNGPMRRSIDRGDTWTLIPSPVTTVTVIESDSTGALLLGGSYGLYRSTDHGDTWTSLHTRTTHVTNSIAVAPGGAIYTCEMTPGVNSGYSYVSTDHGVSWRWITDAANTQFVRLAALPNGTTIAVDNVNGLFRTNDSGRHWTPLPWADRPKITGFSVRGYVVVVVTSKDIRVSTDGGDTWRIDADGLASSGFGPVAISSANEIMVGGMGNGPFRSAGLGFPWNAVCDGFRDRGFTTMAATSTSPLVGVVLARLFRSIDSGVTWERKGVPNWEPYRLLAVGPDGTIYMEAFDRSADSSVRGTGLLRSTDQGATWQGIRAFNRFKTAMQVDSNGDLYLTSDDGNYHPWMARSTDRGATWYDVKLDDRIRMVNVISLVKPGEIMVAGKSGKLFTYARGGDLLQPILQDVNMFGEVTNIVRTGTGSYLATVKDTGVIRSIDGGQSWRPSNSGLPSTSVAALHVAPDGSVLVAGRKFGVYRSFDGGLSWHPAGDGLVDSSIVVFGTAPDGSLYAATNVMGLFRSSVVKVEAAPPWNGPLIDITPNPMSGAAMLNYITRGGDVAVITITDPLGREVMRLADAGAIDGARSLPLNLSTLVDGVYFCRVDQGGASSATKIVVAR